VTATLSYRELVERVLDEREPTIDEIDDLMIELGGGIGLVPLPAGEANLAGVLDCFHAVREIEPDDGANPWNHAAKLKEVDRNTEAAMLYLRAAELFAADARDGTGVTDDSADWGETALWHAVNSLVIAKRPLTASIVARRITDEEHRREAEDTVRAWLGA
jgi:hypothetical protein